jgi:hypothetical protein
MLLSETPLKCGKFLKNPSLFMQLKTKNDGNLFLETVFRYPISRDHDGLNQIDGITTSLGDYEKVSPYLVNDIKGAFDPNHYSVSKRIRIIDPSLNILFSGLEADKNACCHVLKQWVPQISETVNQCFQNYKIKNTKQTKPYARSSSDWT